MPNSTPRVFLMVSYDGTNMVAQYISTMRERSIHPCLTAGSRMDVAEMTGYWCASVQQYTNLIALMLTLQATGMVNDHLTSCEHHAICKDLGA